MRPRPRPDVNHPMIHEILPVGLLQCNCSIFGDEQTRDAMVIDPGDNIEDILAILERQAVMGGGVVMKQSDQEIYDHRDVQASWLGMETPAHTSIDDAARDGDVLTLGPAEFRVLHTPGHTQGSISLWIPMENKLIAGDTLFRDSIGRTDLPGGNPRQILRSIEDKLLGLPEETVVVPGHGPNTTIGREKERNPFLQGL